MVDGYDPDNGDDIYSTGDVIRLRFDIPTYIGYHGSRGNPDPYRPDAAQPTIYSRSGVDALFKFDFYGTSERTQRVPSLGIDYNGVWIDDSTFEVNALF